MKLYKTFPKIGPASIHCSCCNPFHRHVGAVKAARIGINRYQRRQARREVWNEALAA